MRHVIRTRLWLLLLAVVAGAAAAGAGMSPINVDADGVAIHGTDPVAYFTRGAAVAGRPEFSHRWMGATWWFATAEHRDAFAENPEKYAPRYGGY